MPELLRITRSETLNAALEYFFSVNSAALKTSTATTGGTTERKGEGAVLVSNNCSCLVTYCCFAIAFSLFSNQMCEPDLCKPVINTLKEAKNTKKLDSF